MKKVFFLLLVLFIILIVGAGIFLATFDVDSLRPYLTAQLEKALEHPIEIEKISLHWNNAVALEAKNIRVFPGKQNKTTPILAIPSLKGVLEITPLLNRKLEVASIVVHEPSVLLTRLANGTLLGFEPKVQTLSPEAQDVPESSKQAPSGSAALPLSFLVDQVRIENASVVFRDLAQQTEMNIKDVDIAFHDISMLKPIAFSGEASFLSPSQNLKFDGQIKMYQNGWGIENGDLQTSLGSLDLNEAGKAFKSELNTLVGRLEGDLKILLSKLIMDGNGQLALGFDAELHKANIVFANGLPPINHLAVSVKGNEQFINVEKISGQTAGGELLGSGMLRGWLHLPQLSGNLTLTKLDLRQFAGPVQEENPSFEGIGAMTIKAESPPASWDRLDQVLSVSGLLSVREPVIRDFNFVREVFDRLSVLPGLVERLESRLPPEYESKLKVRDTVLEPMDIPFSYDGKVLAIPAFQITSDSFALRGAAGASVQGNFQADTMFQLDKGLSEAVIRTVNEFQYLATPEGRVEIPIRLQGNAQAMQVLPDLNFVARRIAVSKARDFVTGLLEKKEPAESSPTPDSGTSQPQGSVPQPAATQQEPEPSPVQDLFNLFLQNAAGTQGPAKDSTQN